MIWGCESSTKGNKVKERKKERREGSIGFWLGRRERKSLKNLNSVVELIRDDDPVALVHCHTSRAIELALFCSKRSKRPDVVSVLIKDLDPVVFSVADNDPVVLVHCHTLR